jgi:hypothetical protein
MQKLTLHTLRSQTVVLKYILIFIVLLSVFSAWHNTHHVLNTVQECERCLSSIDLDHSIPPKVNFFDSNVYYFSLITLNRHHFYSIFVGITGNKDPPIVIF